MIGQNPFVINHETMILQAFTLSKKSLILEHSHYSWPMTLNKQLPWTMVWASLPVQLRDTSVQLIWRESVKQLSATPLNSCKQGKSLQCPCIKIGHVKKVVNRLEVLKLDDWFNTMVAGFCKFLHKKTKNLISGYWRKVLMPAFLE